MRIHAHPSPNHDDRPVGTAIDTLVLHYTGMRTAEAALERLCDPVAAVSSHYVVLEDGTVLRLVPEERRAWHAGVSAWRGRTGLNANSIGIEIVNPGHEWGPLPYPDAQIEAVIRLSQGILGRWPIDPWGVVGHSDIAPDRKQDPGEWFPWAQLAQAGIGVWPKASDEADPGWLGALLAEIGYFVEANAGRQLAPHPVVAAFQRRFRVSRIDGVADRQTAGLARTVCRLLRSASG